MARPSGSCTRSTCSVSTGRPSLVAGDHRGASSTALTTLRRSRPVGRFEQIGQHDASVALHLEAIDHPRHGIGRIPLDAAGDVAVERKAVGRENSLAVVFQRNENHSVRRIRTVALDGLFVGRKLFHALDLRRRDLPKGIPFVTLPVDDVDGPPLLRGQRQRDSGGNE